MRVIYVSKLSEVKSVFNSEADNVQYYNVLKNSNCIKFYNVELAKPTIRKSRGEILWQTDYESELRELSDLPESQRIKYGKSLEAFFQNFKQTIKKFGNISDDFAKNVMEIPDWSSVLVNEAEDYIIIVNWGFLEDKFNRRDGIIETLFPIPDQSIVVKLVNERNEPIDNQEIILESTNSEKRDKTNVNGFASLGTLTRGKSFTIKFLNNIDGSYVSSDFICDGREQYIIQVRRNVKIKIIVKDNNRELVENQSFFVNSSAYNDQEFNTRQLGNFKFDHKISDEFFEIKDHEGSVIFTEKIPNIDSTFVITYEENIELPEVSEEPEEELDTFHSQVIEDKQPIKLIFLNSFNKPLKNLNIDFVYQNQSYNKTTDKNGQILLDLNIQKVGKLDFLLNRYDKLWNSNIDLNPSDKIYIIKTKPIFPWVWWLVIFLLIILLACCTFGDCFCISFEKTDKVIKDHTEVYDGNNPDAENIIISPCDVQTVSGGHGVTKTQHTLGQKPGKVELIYDMNNIPDKLEVFYQGKLIISTFEVNGNSNGFVGGDLPSGNTATLRFNFAKDRDDYVTVVVTGSNEDTAWEYLISCPK